MSDVTEKKCRAEFPDYGFETGICQLPKGHKGKHSNIIQAQDVTEKKIDLPAITTDARDWEQAKKHPSFKRANAAHADTLWDLACRERQLLAALTRIEELTDAINNIIGHQVLVGGPMAEHSAIGRIARAALLPSPPAEGDQG